MSVPLQLFLDKLRSVLITSQSTYFIDIQGSFIRRQTANGEEIEITFQ